MLSSQMCLAARTAGRRASAAPDQGSGHSGLASAPRLGVPLQPHLPTGAAALSLPRSTSSQTPAGRSSGPAGTASPWPLHWEDSHPGRDGSGRRLGSAPDGDWAGAPLPALQKPGSDAGVIKAGAQEGSVSSLQARLSVLGNTGCISYRGHEWPTEPSAKAGGPWWYGLRLKGRGPHSPSPPRCPRQVQTAHGRQTPGAGHTGQGSGSSPIQAAVPVRQIGR